MGNSEDERDSEGKVLPWTFLEDEPENPQILKLVEEKFKKIEKYLRTGEPKAVVLSYSNPETTSPDRTYTYARELWKAFPVVIEDDLPGNSEKWGLLNRARRGLFGRLGVELRKPESLHRVKEPNWRENHTCYPTKYETIFYHTLGVEVPVEWGSWVDFFTVNLSLEQLKELTQKSGAKQRP